MFLDGYSKQLNPQKKWHQILLPWQGFDGFHRSVSILRRLTPCGRPPESTEVIEQTDTNDQSYVHSDNDNLLPTQWM